MLKPLLGPWPFCCLFLIQFLFKIDAKASLGSLALLLLIPYSILIQKLIGLAKYLWTWAHLLDTFDDLKPIGKLKSNSISQTSPIASHLES